MVVVGQQLLALGLNFGMNSVTLIEVPDDPDGFLSADQLSWSIAATALGAVLGSLLGTPVAPVLGARRLLLLTMPLYALGSLAVGLGGHFGWTLSGRVVMFAAFGMSEGSVRGYVSEIVPPTRRALFTTLLNFMVYLGQVLALAVAPLLHWQVLFIVVGVVPAALCLFGLLFLPNSAKWLLSRGNSEEEALRSIRFFRGAQVDAAAEVRTIHDSLQDGRGDGAALPVWTLLRQRVTLRPLLLASVQMVLYVWCGGATLTLITAFVLAPVRLPLSEYQRSTLPAALSALVCIPGGIIIERYGRLPVLRLGGALSTVGCATIAAYFFLAAESQERLGWIVLAGAALALVAHVGLLGNVAFGYATELLPNKTRTLASNIVITVLRRLT
ncbi:sugar transporter ERD6-like 9 [Pollicipes pollicipes]|uniref:sugar transporter ERD6-like 9 n=1 Tax=Pollicipes pollicipes TaxID=41117 RepID=UPI0018851ADF|nr:sugar transporter ERD6-like 9 [Pollicipes pollicipes]